MGEEDGDVEKQSKHRRWMRWKKGKEEERWHPYQTPKGFADFSSSMLVQTAVCKRSRINVLDWRLGAADVL